MITTGSIRTINSIDKDKHVTFIINLKNIDVTIETINENLYITLKNKNESERALF